MNIYEHLYSRSFDPARYKATFEYEPQGVAVGIPLWNLSGELVGSQTYRPWSTDKKCNDPKLGRYYTYISSGKDGVFGLEQDQHKTPLFIVEGIFKAAKLHSLGYDAIAVLTSHPKRMRPWFRILKQTRKLIAIGDNDSAGQKLVNTIKSGKLSPVDLDEMTDQEVHDFVQEFL